MEVNVARFEEFENSQRLKTMIFELIITKNDDFRGFLYNLVDSSQFSEPSARKILVR